MKTIVSAPHIVRYATLGDIDISMTTQIIPIRGYVPYITACAGVHTPMTRLALMHVTSPAKAITELFTCTDCAQKNAKPTPVRAVIILSVCAGNKGMTLSPS
jgi:hypothetical protein